MKVDHSKTPPWWTGQRVVFATYDSDDADLVRLDGVYGIVTECYDDEWCIVDAGTFGIIEDVDPYALVALEE